MIFILQMQKKVAGFGFWIGTEARDWCFVTSESKTRDKWMTLVQQLDNDIWFNTTAQSNSNGNNGDDATLDDTYYDILW